MMQPQPQQADIQMWFSASSAALSKIRTNTANAGVNSQQGIQQEAVQEQRGSWIILPYM